MADYNLGTAKGKIQVDYDGKGVTDAKKDLGSVDKTARGTSEGFRKAATGAQLAGVGIAAGFGLAAKTAMDFEQQISAIGAVSGATQAELDTLSKKALDIGAKTSFSATQAASAMEELAKAGISLPDILNGAADATVALAAAGGVALPEAASLAADAMNSFALKASDMPHIADLIAGAANASSISVNDFGFSLKAVGAVANLTKTSFDDTAAAIALMGKMGIKGSDAGTSLKTMLMNLNPTTDKQKTLMKELGLVTKDGANAFFDAAGKAKPLAEISQTLQNALKGMTQQQKLATLETLFGSDAIRAAAVMSDAGAKGFNDVAAAMGKVSAEDVAAKRLDNTAGKMEALKGSAETLAIQLGQVLLPAIKSIIDGLNSFVGWLSGLSEGTKTTILWIVGISGAILLFVGTVYKIMQAAKAFMVVWRALNLSFLASPIGLIIIAIVALVAIIVLIATKTTWFQDLWNWAWGGIKKAAAAVADWFMGTIVPSLKKAWDQLWSIIKWVIDAVVAYFKFWIGVYQWLGHGIMLVVQGVIAWFKWWYNLGKSIGEAIVAFWQGAVARFKATLALIKAVVDMVIGFFKRMRDTVADHLSSLISFVKGIPGKISSALGNIGSLLYRKGREVVQGLINGIKDMLGNLRNVAGDVVGVIGRFLPGSPAKEGPLSGRGYVLKRGQRMTQDFARGILSTAKAAKDAVARVMAGAAEQMPTPATPAVAGAQAGMASVQIRPAVAPSSGSTSTTRTINLGGVSIQGVWDLDNPDVPRKFVARLHRQLDDYEREHR